MAVSCDGCGDPLYPQVPGRDGGADPEMSGPPEAVAEGGPVPGGGPPVPAVLLRTVLPAVAHRAAQQVSGAQVVSR